MRHRSKVWNGVAKKAKRIKIRRSWTINPKTRIKKSKKKYCRKDKERIIKDETPFEILEE